MKDTTDRRTFLKTLGLGAAVMASGFCGKKSSKPPNIVVVFTDDQGYSDLGCFGAEGFTTPHIDRMAEEGMRFTNFYVGMAVCSASRAALMTGCYPNRVSVLGAYSPQAKAGLNPQEETIAKLLKKRGYVCGVFGKWHLGHHHPFLPLQNGFDEYYGLPYSNDMWPIDYDGSLAPKEHRKAQHPWPPLYDGNEIVSRVRSMEDQDGLTSSYVDRALRFIEKNRENPFFLYLPHSMPHTPLGVSDRFKGKSAYGKYGDVIMEIDWGMGQIFDTLRRLKLEDKTMILFTSDNGPWKNFGRHAGTCRPFREGKGTTWEGGVRVPCVIKWPGRIKPGSVCRRMASTMDILPTLAEMTGASLPSRPIDGVSILPLLRGDPGANPRNQMIYYYGKQLQCVREGKWKLHFPHGYRSYENVEPGKNGVNGPYGKGVTGLALYDLESDPGERNDVAALYPAVVNRLSHLGESIRKDLGDRDITGKGVRPPGQFLSG